MSLYPEIAAGQSIRASLLQSMLTQEIVKQGDTDITTAAFSQDPELTVSLEADAVYRVEFRLLVGGRANTDAAGGDFRTEWAVPLNASGLKNVHGPSSVASANANADGVTARMGVHNFDTDVPYRCVRNSTGLYFEVLEWCNNLSTNSAGTLALRWCQNVAHTTATRVAAGSVLRVRRIG